MYKNTFLSCNKNSVLEIYEMDKNKHRNDLMGLPLRTIFFSSPGRNCLLLLLLQFYMIYLFLIVTIPYIVNIMFPSLSLQATAT